MIRHQRLLIRESPPGGVEASYKDADTGYVSKGRSLDALIAAARFHRTQNGFQIPEDFDWQVETQLCQAHPGRCVARDGLPLDSSCIHRGELIRWEGCETCGGVRAKIVACAIHGEASEFRHEMPPAKPCWSCADRISRLTSEG